MSRLSLVLSLCLALSTEAASAAECIRSFKKAAEAISAALFETKLARSRWKIQKYAGFVSKTLIVLNSENDDGPVTLQLDGFVTTGCVRVSRDGNSIRFDGDTPDEAGANIEVVITSGPDGHLKIMKDGTSADLSRETGGAK